MNKSNAKGQKYFFYNAMVYPIQPKIVQAADAHHYAPFEIHGIQPTKGKDFEPARIARDNRFPFPSKIVIRSFKEVSASQAAQFIQKKPTAKSGN